MSWAWPISLFYLPGHSDGFREGHVIQGGPVRVSPGILSGTIGKETLLLLSWYMLSWSFWLPPCIKAEETFCK